MRFTQVEIAIIFSPEIAVLFRRMVLFYYTFHKENFSFLFERLLAWHYRV